MENSYKWFSNKECEYYPCHKAEEMNCLFCYCPLYFLEDCGGNKSILENGVKDCSKCMIPHSKNSYDYIINRITKENENAKNKTETEIEDYS